MCATQHTSHISSMTTTGMLLLSVPHLLLCLSPPSPETMQNISMIPMYLIYAAASGTILYQWRKITKLELQMLENEKKLQDLQLEEGMQKSHATQVSKNSNKMNKERERGGEGEAKKSLVQSAKKKTSNSRTSMSVENTSAITAVPIGKVNSVYRLCVGTPRQGKLVAILSA